MVDDKFEGLSDGEWFCDDIGDQYWTCDTGHVVLADRRERGTRHKVLLKVKVEPGGLYGAVNDISIGGALVDYRSPIPQGSYVELTLQAEADTARVGGLVRWRQNNTLGRLPGGRAGMGIEFVWMSLQMRSLLEQAQKNTLY